MIKIPKLLIQMTNNLVSGNKVWSWLKFLSKLGASINNLKLIKKLIYVEGPKTLLIVMPIS